MRPALKPLGPEPRWQALTNWKGWRGWGGQMAWVLLGLLPLGHLLLGVAFERLGPNPAEALIRGTGEWALRGLWLTLAITPLRQALGWPALGRFRRTCGLLAFFYALLHFCAYAVLDMEASWQAVVQDIPKRPFALVGALALLLMLPLAATSFNAAIRRLGAARWRALHLSVHAVAALALLHFFWMRAAKNRWGEVAVYAALLLALWAWRLKGKWRRAASPDRSRQAPG
jgi:sulfoxide reductase heme-binding subunit YedZ